VTLHATGGVLPYTWSIDRTMLPETPAWLHIHPMSGELYGTPQMTDRTGDVQFVVQLLDHDTPELPVNQVFTIRVLPSPSYVLNVSLDIPSRRTEEGWRLSEVSGTFGLEGPGESVPPLPFSGTRTTGQFPAFTSDPAVTFEEWTGVCSITSATVSYTDPMGHTTDHWSTGSRAARASVRRQPAGLAGLVFSLTIVVTDPIYSSDWNLMMTGFNV
jgi:hypothetical protein